LLTKASWWCGGLFIVLSFLLALASTRSRAPKSVLDQTFQTPATAPAPANAAPATNANPAVPLAPAPNAAPNSTAPAGAKAPATTAPATKKP
jgi:preprotein translocase subunit SecG